MSWRIFHTRNVIPDAVALGQHRSGAPDGVGPGLSTADLSQEERAALLDEAS